MTTSTVKTNLLGLTQQEMEKFFDSIGEKRFRAGQVMKWIHHFGVDDFDAMTNVSKALRDKLKVIAEVRGPEVVSEDISSDGTRKWVVRVASGSCVETVYIPQGKRGTLCVSSRQAVPWTAVSAPPASKASIATSPPPKSSARCGLPTNPLVASRQSSTVPSPAW